MAKEFGALIAVGILLICFIELDFCVSSSEYEQNENYYFEPSSYHIRSYSIEKLREKRQTTKIENGNQYHQSHLLNINESKENITANTSAENADQTYNTKNKADVKQEPPGSVGGQSTSIIPMPTSDKPLLGVNGTGQRKIYLDKSTIKPIAVVSEPIPSVPKKPNQFPKKTLSTPLQPVDTVMDDLLNKIDVPENETVATLESQHFTINKTSDHHLYYNSTIYVDKQQAEKYWNSFKNISHTPMLSQSHRRAMTVELSFDFPFYGNIVRNVTVTTGGFLYTGEYVHLRLAATQYIAPLMANFATNLSNDSYVRLNDNGTAFTVIWENVYLQDKQDVGKFTFSAVLHNTGDIVFIYFNIPISIHSIQDDKHPVKVGLSDAYIIDRAVFFTRRKTIYEYHRVNFGGTEIQNSSFIYLKALPTCLSYTDCGSCINHNTTFSCAWCPMLNRCSSGTDRKRQDWLHKECDKNQVSDEQACHEIAQKTNYTEHEYNEVNHSDLDVHHGGVINWDHIHDNDENPLLPISKDSLESSIHSSASESKSMGLAISFMLPVCLVMTILIWIFYAYRNPHTKSGQLLIQYRPSQWSWRRGEARYTAATIHM